MTPTTNAPQHNSHDEIDLFELAEDLWKQKWLILGVTALITSLALAYALLATPVYQATASVMPPRVADIAPINLGRDRAELEDLDVEEAYAIFTRNLTSQTTRRWFYEELYRPYLLKKGISGSRDSLTERMREVLVVAKPDERSSPDNYAVNINLDDPDLAATFANRFVEEVSKRSLNDLEMNSRAQLANKRRALEERIEVLRISALDERKDRIARLKEALKIAETVGLDSPQVTQGQTGAESNLAQVIDGNLLYMRGSRAIRSELELLEGRVNDDPFITELRGLEQQISLLKFIGPVPETVKLFTLDSPADVPDRPIKPKKALIVVLGTVMGGVLGGIIAIGKISIRRRNLKQKPSSLQQ